LLRLDLEENLLSEIPLSLSGLTTLSELNLSKNKISTVHPEIFVNMKNLVSLDLHQNQLRFFNSVPASTKLDTLSLVTLLPYRQGFNFLEGIEGLENAPNLTVLDLHNNKLDNFPDSILQLTELKTLKVSNNNLGDINPRVSLLSNLVRINIEGNPLKCIKATMRNAGADQLKKYLKMR